MSTPWQSLTVAPEQTHHLLDGVPAYAARFEEVLKFHPPGLAPVRDASGAYHIDSVGQPFYTRRFIRTFGFYELRAAVHAVNGWLHITSDGAPLYSARYSWCGNYQGSRCTVRDVDRCYFHIDLNGQTVYSQRYRYAGDYRDGVAVVQAENGLHSHIDYCGRLIHNQWFDDLDVFHKGFARARDRHGWHHIDSTGRPLYERRFDNVEPFYNGQARGRTATGGLLIIDETGRDLVVLRP